VVQDRHNADVGLLIAGLSLLIGVLGSQDQALLTTLVTFGALTAYLLLHIAVLVHFAVREKSRRYFLHVASPPAGIAVLGYALWNANIDAKIFGVAWIIVGAVIGALTQISARKRGRIRANSPPKQPPRQWDWRWSRRSRPKEVVCHGLRFDPTRQPLARLSDWFDRRRSGSWSRWTVW
jgi:hypothetical protein